MRAHHTTPPITKFAIIAEVYLKIIKAFALSAVMLKKYAEDLAYKKGYGDDFKLLETIERTTPELFASYKGLNKPMCANVDLYSGLVYRMLGIPVEMYTPLFAIARVSGWCAHRIEEFHTAKRIIRPAYKCLFKQQDYIPLDER